THSWNRNPPVRPSLAPHASRRLCPGFGLGPSPPQRPQDRERVPDRAAVPRNPLACDRLATPRGSEIDVIGLMAFQLGLESAGEAGYLVGLFLHAIPFMSDTAVNYFYSLLNQEGKAVGRWPFIIANLIGGILRTYLFLWLLPG